MYYLILRRFISIGPSDEFIELSRGLSTAVATEQGVFGHPPTARLRWVDAVVSTDEVFPALHV